MFGKELPTMVKLLEKVLSELETSNKIQKELLEAIHQNTKYTRSLVIHAQTLTANHNMPKAD